MTQDFVERFKLSSDNTQIPIKGIGNLTTYTSGVVTTDIISRINNYETKVQFHVVKSITHALPASSLDVRKINIPTSLQGQLADLKWNQLSEVNALLGADVFYELFTGQRVKISNQSSLHITMLGWIVTGKTYPASYGHQETSVVVSPEHTSDSISLYSTKVSRHLEEEELTENHFKSHTYRDDDGRFVVRLPLSKDVCMLRNSRYIAEKRFLNIERKLQRDKALADEYQAFMREYLHMGHMKLVNSSELPSTSTYYLPHHAMKNLIVLPLKLELFLMRQLLQLLAYH
ncbi:uncharacterized protein LOC112681098 [Sipha flava]|uniref:Uncharacterized protein LOC112681098 n=1 Tax=Sipha flava TaxID=143950 RepID=A0A8B8F9U6_9HEMI|nr:uncharacterized protein LOC112681098 [Sipha flava]